MVTLCTRSLPCLEVQLLLEKKKKVFFSNEMLSRNHRPAVFSRQYLFVMLVVSPPLTDFLKLGVSLVP
jgi:hypothetical protein